MPTFLHMGPSSARGPAIAHVGTLAHVQISGLTCGRGGYQRQQTTGGRHQLDAGAAHPRIHSEAAQAVRLQHHSHPVTTNQRTACHIVTIDIITP